MRTKVLLGCSLLLLSTIAEAKIYLAWEYPRRYTPGPVAFAIVLAGEESTQGERPGQRQMKVAATPPWACAVLPDDVENTFCAELACPGAGLYAVTVAAVWEDGEQSSPSEPLGIQVITTPVCAALRITLPTDTPPFGTTPVPRPCASRDYTPQTIPMPTTMELPSPEVLTAELKTPTPTPPAPPLPRVPAPVRTVAPAIAPRTPKAVHHVGAPPDTRTVTVYAGPSHEVPVPQPPDTRVPLPPCR
jgi:hypothetical protein